MIGATVEDAGFSTHTSAADLRSLREKAADLVPSLADAPEIESWAGLRPRTAALLPIIGRLAPQHFIAAGHFRNGILLAPGTARVMTQLLLGEPASIDLLPFTPQRFAGPGPAPAPQPVARTSRNRDDNRTAHPI